jgi:hypothetical protein
MPCNSSEVRWLRRHVSPPSSVSECLLLVGYLLGLLFNPDNEGNRTLLYRPSAELHGSANPGNSILYIHRCENLNSNIDGTDFQSSVEWLKSDIVSCDLCRECTHIRILPFEQYYTLKYSSYIVEVNDHGLKTEITSHWHERLCSACVRFFDVFIWIRFTEHKWYWILEILYFIFILCLRRCFIVVSVYTNCGRGTPYVFTFTTCFGLMWEFSGTVGLTITYFVSWCVYTHKIHTVPADSSTIRFHVRNIQANTHSTSPTQPLL